MTPGKRALRLAIDCVVFGLDLAERALKVLLIERELPPFRGRWALPGGFVTPAESVDDAARRELREETGLEGVFLEQLYTFGAPERDPRGRVVSVAYYALVSIDGHTPRAASDARRAEWFTLRAAPRLAFDHDAILRTALQRLRGKLVYEPIGFELLPEKFTLSQLQKLYELVLEKPLDKRNFRKKLLGTRLLVDLRETQRGVSHRAPKLYRFDQRKYRDLKKKGRLFEL